MSAHQIEHPEFNKQYFETPTDKFRSPHMGKWDNSKIMEIQCSKVLTDLNDLHQMRK